VVTKVPNPDAARAEDAPDTLFPGEGIVVVKHDTVPGEEEAMAIVTVERGTFDLQFHGEQETVVVTIVVGVAGFIDVEDGVGRGMGAVGECAG